MKKPDILMFISDHFRSDALSVNGNQAVQTKHIDAVALNDGISIDNAFCQNPVCVPSRCSFLSGRYPHTGGFRTMHHLHGPDDLNLLRELKKQGYHIYFGGKNDVFREDVPLSEYCDYRSDAYKEMGTKAAGKPLPEGYTPILDQFTQEQAAEASAIKEASRKDPDSRYYYAIYQGEVSHDNPLAAGSLGAEDVQIMDAVNYLRNYHGEAPLCMYLSLVCPHPWYAAFPEDYERVCDAYVRPAIRLTDEQRARKASILEGIRKNHRLYQWSDEELFSLKKTYHAMIGHVDENFGRVMNALKDTQRYDDSLIFMYSDHGDYAGDYEITEINQNTFEDCLSKVPLVIKPPKGYEVRPGNRRALAELLDIPATVAEIAGFELSEDEFGKSLVHLFASDEEHRGTVLCEGGRRQSEKQCEDDNHSPDTLWWARTSVQTRIPEHTKAVMLRDHDYKYVFRYYESDELYDLKQDPEERQNLAGDPEYAGIIQHMKNILLERMIETCDVVPRTIDKRI